MIIKTLDERLNKHIVKHESGCWFWNGAHANYSPVIGNKTGSGSVKRLLFTKYRQEEVLDGYLKSSCQNNKCINPFHLITREQSLQAFICINKQTSCWEWTGQIKGGYGFFSFQGKERLVHRVMYERHKGIIPPKINVCHSCDNPKCCNPDHLWLGTQADNVHDMITKNRDKKSFGASHYFSKLTEQDAKNIKQKYKEGMKMTQISRLLNLPYRAVQHVCANETWKHVQI